MELLNVPKHRCCGVHVAGGVLPEAEFGHFVHQFGVEEALLPRLGLAGLGFQCIDALLIGDLAIKAGGAGWNSGYSEKSEDRHRNH